MPDEKIIKINYASESTISKLKKKSTFKNPIPAMKNIENSHQDQRNVLKNPTILLCKLAEQGPTEPMQLFHLGRIGKSNF